MNPERDEYLDDDESRRFSPRSILAAGWFRALLVLGALAMVLVVSVPYLLRWLDGAPSVERPKPVVATPLARVPVPAPGPTPAAPAQAVPAPSDPSVASSKTEPLQPVPPAAAPPPAAPQAKPRKDSAPPAAEAKRATARAPGRAAAKAGTPDASAPAPAAAGSYWVQVGAFQDVRNAEQLASTLRAQQVPVQVVPVIRGSSGGAAHHEVVVSGASVEAVTAALRGSGTAQQAGAGVAVRPLLGLREAVALSRRLAGEGLSVKIRRAGDGAPSTHHLVRVGGYPSRAAAEAGRTEMASRGLPGFVTQGPAR